MALTDAEFDKLFEEMKSKFQPEKTADMDAVVQFNLTGENEATYYVHIKNGNAVIEQGESQDAQTTFIANAEDYADVVYGRMNGMQAFMQGKLKVKGDMGLAMKLQSVFGL